MKKLLISVLIIAPLLAGCTTIDTRLTINKDKSAQVVSSLTYEGNLADTSDKNYHIIADNFGNFLDDDYSVESAYGTKFSTITGSKKVDNLFENDIDLSSLGFRTLLPSGRFVDVKKNFFITSYNINSVYNYQDVASKVQQDTKKIEAQKSVAMVPEYLQKYGDESEEIDDEDTENQDRVDFAANLDASAEELNKEDKDDVPINPPAKTEPENNDVNVSFSVQLPAFAYYNNADSTDGNIYTWNIKKDAPTEIKIQYVKYSGFAIFSVIIFGALLLIYLAYRIIRHENQKRVGTNN